MGQEMCVAHGGLAWHTCFERWYRRLGAVSTEDPLLFLLELDRLENLNNVTQLSVLLQHRALLILLSALRTRINANLFLISQSTCNTELAEDVPTFQRYGLCIEVQADGTFQFLSEVSKKLHSRERNLTLENARYRGRTINGR